MFTQTSISAIFCLGWLAVPLNAVPLPDDSPKRGPIDPETIAAYGKLGAIYGGFTIKGFGMLRFSPGHDAAAKGLPGFRLATRPDETLQQLPPVQVAFGMDISGTKVTDVGLRNLQNLKNLTSLKLGNTDVTDAGLKELKILKNLTWLHLGNTEVTDAGATELKNLTNLTSLHLGSTEVTDVGLKNLKDLKNLTSLNLSGPFHK